MFLKQYNASRAKLLLIAGYEDDGKDGIRPASVTDKIVCVLCGNGTVECERTVDPNTMRSIDYDERVPNYAIAPVAAGLSYTALQRCVRKSTERRENT